MPDLVETGLVALEKMYICYFAFIYPWKEDVPFI